MAFVLDPPFLRGERAGAPLVQAFFDAIAALREDLRARASDLALLEGPFEDELAGLTRRLDSQALFFNEDYEPDAIARDRRVFRVLRSMGVDVHVDLDHVYFGKDEVLQNDGRPYRVFTPYKRRWLDCRRTAARPPLPSQRLLEAKLLARDAIGPTRETPVPQEFAHAASARYPRVSQARAERLLDAFLMPGGPAECYRELRDIPAAEATSQLSPHLRAGTIGIRTCVERAFAACEQRDPAARQGIETWIAQLIWRDFYQQLLAHEPRVATQPYLAAGSRIRWRDAPADFQAWCAGRTGYPIVDAAMRQLVAFGWMHNRLRMICASFLSKDLLIDWRFGERFFERHLADADLAQNNGGWQWSASCGTDAAPYFRVFNPVVQGRRFDPDGTFVKAMVPELARLPPALVHAPWEAPTAPPGYPPPIVEHARARERALAVFGAAFAKPCG